MKIIFVQNKEVKQIANYITPIVALNNNNLPLTTCDEIVSEINNGKFPSGSFAFAKKISDTECLLCRDKWGTKKLFFVYDNLEDILILSDNFISLSQKVNLEKIKSVKRGSTLRLSKSKNIENFYLGNNSEKFNLAEIECKIKNFMRIISNSAYDEVFISLSGGLDSAVIATIAKDIIPSANLITAALMNKSEISDYTSSKFYRKEKFVDLTIAEEVGKTLNMPHTILPISKENIIRSLKKIMFSCQDWRDFNVHCASMNFTIGNYISNNYKKKNIAIITGDFMNEIFSDYTSEIFNNEVYYPQARVSKHTRQKFFLRGLDSSDREVGVYKFFGIDCFQPYSCVIDNYLAAGQSILEGSNSKFAINSQLIIKEIKDIVSVRKTRAQVGDIEGGILGLFIKNGLTEIKLKELFSYYFKIPNNSFENFIRLGEYRT